MSSRVPEAFFGNKPFSRANKALAAAGFEGIDWSLEDCLDSTN
jgi:uracil DNA glycosylase